MPMLGDIFIDYVEQEDYDESVDSTNHPIEGGKEITDHIEQKPVMLSITGIITGKDASARLSKLRDYMNKGKLLNYSYRSVIDSVIITSFPHSHTKEVKGGFEFSLTLKKIRIATVGVVKKASQPKKTAAVSNKGRQQPTGAVAKSYTVKQGDTLTKIAKKTGTTAQKLYNKNRGTIGANPNLIYPKQKIIIPREGSLKNVDFG